MCEKERIFSKIFDMVSKSHLPTLILTCLWTSANESPEFGRIPPIQDKLRSCLNVSILSKKIRRRGLLSAQSISRKMVFG